MLLIPLIAFALAKGSDMAFVSMATGLMAPAQGASSGASAQAAAGNFNAGNISMGNTSMNSASANKSDLSSSWSDPYASKSQTAYGSVTRDETGTVTGMARTSIDLGVSSSGALTHSRTTGTASSSATTLTASESAALSLSSAATSSNAVSREFARAMSQGLSERLSAGSLLPVRLHLLIRRALENLQPYPEVYRIPRTCLSRAAQNFKPEAEKHSSPQMLQRKRPKMPREFLPLRLRI